MAGLERARSHHSEDIPEVPRHNSGTDALVNGNHAVSEIPSPEERVHEGASIIPEPVRLC